MGYRAAQFLISAEPEPQNLVTWPCLDMATTALTTDRWSGQNLEAFRAHKRKRSDGNIAKHVAILEKLAAENGGYLPTVTWMTANGYFTSYEVMKAYPAVFAHLPTESDKKFEIYHQHNHAATGQQTILPPAKFRNLSEYNVQGAHFNPTELAVDNGLSEGDWMELGRTLATVCQSAFWWVGDWMLYGFRTFGKKVTYDLAQQATGYSRNALYSCSHVVKRFPPERRVAALTFFHHILMAGFPPDVADRYLAEAVELGWTARQIKALAEKECGKKQKEKQRYRVPVYLWPAAYDALKERAEGMELGAFIAQIVEEYIVGKPIERYSNGQKTHAWKAAVKGATV